MNEHNAVTASETATSLKYEKTQNRDIISTIERINRAEKFRPTAEKLVSAFGEAAYETARKVFREEWRSAHDSHENPKSLTVEVSVGSPVYRKDADGFHYSMTVSTTFFVEPEPNPDETAVETETRMAMWFSEKIGDKLVRRVTDRLAEITGKDPALAQKFCYVQKAVHAGEETPKIGSQPTLGKVNVTYMAQMRNRKAESSTLDTVPFRDSDAIREGLVSNMAMALERTASAVTDD